MPSSWPLKASSFSCKSNSREIISMYGNWQPPDDQSSLPYTHYHRDIPNDMNRGSSNMYGYNPSPQSGQLPSVHAPQQPQSLGHPSQNHRAANPRLTVQQTNQTLSELESERRLSSNLMTITQIPPYRAQYYASEQGYAYDKYAKPSSSTQGARPNQLPSTSHPMNTATQKPTDGHACVYCGKSFGRPSALKIHMAVHTGERAYTCPEAACQRKFSVRSNMSRHLRNVHQIWLEGGNDSGDEGEDKTSA